MSGFIFPQIAGATIYQPGETLEPDCAPGSADCGVAVFNLNGLSVFPQTLAAGTAGTDFSITSADGVHTFNLPSASSLARGLLTAGDWSIFNAKQNALGYIPANLANNLSDLADASSARTNLGLGTLATQSGTFSGTSSGTNTGDQDLSGLLVKTNNLSDLADAGIARANLGLGTLALLSTINNDNWSGAGLANANLANSSISFSTGASGTDFNISGSSVPLGGTLTLNIPTASAFNRGLLSSADWSDFKGKQSALGYTPLDAANDLSDLADVSSARTNLGLGTLATQSGTFSGTSSGTNTGDQTTITGNAGTAAALQTARTINGVSFDGTSDITVPAAAGTLTGAALASGVTASSLTSLGTLSSLVLSGAVTGATNYNGLVVAADTGVVTSGTWNGTAIAVAHGGTGTANGSITGTGALSFTSNAANTLTLDSGTTGAVNLGTNTYAKNITVGNSTLATSLLLKAGTGGIALLAANTGNISITSGSSGSVTLDSGTAVNINSGSGNINFQVAGTRTTGNVQVGSGGEGSETPDLLVLDIKRTSEDPRGTNGAMYYNSDTNKFRCFEKDWVDCITNSAVGSDLQHAASFDTSDNLTNIASSQVIITSVSVTPSTATGDVYVRAKAEILSGNDTDQNLVLSIKDNAVCTGSVLATKTINIASASDTIVGDFEIAAVEVDAGASSQSYSFCASTVTGDSDIRLFEMFATVIDTGADLAEIYTTDDESIEAGDVVSYDFSLNTGVKKSANAYDQNVLGIVSKRPGAVIGDVDKEGVKALPVALSGRVPVKVVAENGAIQPGDYLTPSSTSGAAMKAKNFGPVIGQAMSAYSGEGVGTITAFVKNFDLGAVQQTAIFAKDALIKADSDGTDNGLSALIAAVQSETAYDPVALIAKEISDGRQFLAGFLAARVTAIRGYFDEVFAQKVHTGQICVKKSDNSEVCINGDQVNSLLQDANIVPAASFAPDGGETPPDNSDPVSSGAPPPEAGSIIQTSSATSTGELEI